VKYQTSKVTIVTGSSVLHTVWVSVLRIHSHGGAMLMFVHIHGATLWVEKKLAFLLFADFWLKILPQLNINVVRKLKTKFRHHSHTIGNVCANFHICTTFGFWGSVWRRMCLFLSIFGLYFCVFLQKNIFQKSKCMHHPCTWWHLCAKFDVL